MKRIATVLLILALAVPNAGSQSVFGIPGVGAAPGGSGGGGGGASFPITATNGTTTISATGVPVTQFADYTVLDAATGAGWNAGLGAGLGTSLFSFNPTLSASVSVSPITEEVLTTVTEGAVTSTVRATTEDFTGAMIRQVTATSDSSVTVRDNGFVLTSSATATSALANIFGVPSDPRLTFDVDDAIASPAPVSMSLEIRGLRLPFVGGGVISAATITPRGNVFRVTGTTNINNITNSVNLTGLCVVMVFDDALTVSDGGGNIQLAGAFVTTAGDTLHVCSDGLNWYEISRSVN